MSMTLMTPRCADARGPEIGGVTTAVTDGFVFPIRLLPKNSSSPMSMATTIFIILPAIGVATAVFPTRAQALIA